MSPLDAEVLELERCALRAWPADHSVELDGWRLRAMEGVTRRANSAWTAEAGTLLGLAERVRHAEAFYRECGLPVLIQVIPRTQPDPLDTMLQQAGYIVDAPVSIQTAPIDRVLGRLDAPALECVVTERATGDWMHVAVDRGRFRDQREPFMRLLERLETRAIYVTVLIDAKPASIALGVRDGLRIGVFNMSTLSEHRRRGAARAALAALLMDARGRGAEDAYLQVERANRSALSLYERAGFEERYGYHYRRKAS